MAHFLEIALSSFWSFVGAVFLLWMMIRILGAATVAIIALLSRRAPRAVDQATIIRIVREALDRGKLDAPIARILQRNRQRRG